MKNITICMYGAASNSVDSFYLTQAEDLGKEIALRGHSLIYGGGGSGLMGACARGVTSQGGEIIGVVPTFMNEFEDLYTECTEMVVTNTMAQRKEIMEDRADAFVIVPGGVGTMDEFFQIITLAELNRKNSPIVLYNMNGYYDPIIEFIENGIKSNFIRPGVRDLYCIKNTASEVLDAIEEKLS